MTALQVAVISAVIIFGFAAWLIAHKRSERISVERWQKAYAEKLKRQHDEAAMANQDDYCRIAGRVDVVAKPIPQVDRRLTHARNRVEFYRLELAKAERAKQGGIGIARAKLNDAVNVVLKLEGASK